MELCHVLCSAGILCHPLWLYLDALYWVLALTFTVSSNDLNPFISGPTGARGTTAKKTSNNKSESINDYLFCAKFCGVVNKDFKEDVRIIVKLRS